MIPGGIYPNMMMPNTMMAGGMMPSTGMELVSNTGMEIMSQSPLDMTAMGAQTMPAASGTPIEIGMMGGMMMDPSMIGMYPGGGGGDTSSTTERKEILLKHCKLTPPRIGATQPSRRVRPPGCRTIYVGGLPDEIRESIVREIFENYGRIHTLRLSTKNFCHIRFDQESCVDAAMLISGYHIKLLSKDQEDEVDNKANSGWLHVDYALVSYLFEGERPIMCCVIDILLFFRVSIGFSLLL